MWHYNYSRAFCCLTNSWTKLNPTKHELTESAVHGWTFSMTKRGCLRNNLMVLFSWSLNLLWNHIYGQSVPGGRARLWSVPEMPTPVNIQRYRTFLHLLEPQEVIYCLSRQSLHSQCWLTSTVSAFSNQVYLNDLKLLQQSFIFREMLCLGLWHVSCFPAHSVDRYSNIFKSFILHKYPCQQHLQSPCLNTITHITYNVHIQYTSVFQ